VQEKRKPQKTPRNNQCGVGILIFVITASSGFFFFLIQNQRAAAPRYLKKFTFKEPLGVHVFGPKKIRIKEGALHTLKEPPGFLKELTNTGQFSRQFI